MIFQRIKVQIRKCSKKLIPLIGLTAMLLPVSNAHAQTCFSYTGAMQTWTVPSGVTRITAEAWGAQGGNSTWGVLRPGGLGAYVRGENITVTPGSTLQILVGGQGESLAVGGGGGGSFLATSGNTPLLVAGGGGGASSDNDGVGGVVTEGGTADSLGAVSGGSGGSGGNVCGINQNDGGGGGGFFSNGADANSGGNGGFGGIAFVNGGAIVPGGRLDNACNADPAGGFGGGGSATCNTVGGGGGGGYSGGAGGAHISNCGTSSRAGGGGGGSFNSGTNQTNTPAVKSGNGEICIHFNAGPVPARDVPTINEWGMIIFMVLAGLGSLYYLRRKQTTG